MMPAGHAVAQMEPGFVPKLSDREARFLEQLADRCRIGAAELRRIELALLDRGERLVAALLKLGTLSEENLLVALAEFLGLSVLRSHQLPAVAVPVPGLNLALLKAREVVPIAVDGRHMQVLCWDPLDSYVERALRFGTGLTPQLILATRSQVLDQLERLYPALYPPEGGGYSRRWT